MFGDCSILSRHDQIGNKVFYLSPKKDIVNSLPDTYLRNSNYQNVSSILIKLTLLNKQV